jgi:hypothetical protein
MMVFPSVRTWIAAIAALWPLQALAHPDVSTDAGITSYVVATAATMVLLFAMLLLPRMFRLVRSIGRRGLAHRAARREANDA